MSQKLGARRARHLKTEHEAGYRAPTCRRLDETQHDCLFDLYYFLKHKYKADEAMYRHLVGYATGDASFPSLMQRRFDEHDVDNNNILSEDEWPTFLQRLRDDVVAIEGQSIPELDAQLASHFYYVFNNISSDHAGISMAKLLKARQLYARVEREAEAGDAANKRIRPRMQRQLVQLVVATIIVIFMLIYLGCTPDAYRDKHKNMPGYITKDMERLVVEPRPDLEEKLQK